MLQRLESSRAVGQWSGAHDNSFFSSSSKMAQGADEAMSESSLIWRSWRS